MLDFLLALLDQPDVLVRNRACIALHEIGDSRAVPALLQAIRKPENEAYRGSLVYALEYLDCQHLLPDLFDLLFYGDSEVQMGAKRILDHQSFTFRAMISTP
ncbi:HEAT repeat domain-containing protein [Hymenobacter volaticus]|uniref:HEAT repeat domain-containing protein n=1 Tax=Hymenobacter volaticus TaxID=2932254 RepID=A0ABY4GEY9_9BACT|nr:HEAT repeat domain-containing protein [Hymenobacter volaticus]UOQ69307.1 HEAT repeat domain-containing protein [Hymenobacter volaticus]